MIELTVKEKELLLRYIKLVNKNERYTLFKISRQASNTLLNSIEATILKDSPTDYQLTYLEGINRRRSKNYRKLTGIDKLLKVTTLFRIKTLKDLGLVGEVDP